MRIKLRLSRLLPGVLAVFSYLLFLLATLPAVYIVPRLPLPAGLKVYDIQGTLWQGQIGELQWQQHVFRHITWDVLWRRLWLGMPTVEVVLHDKENIEGHLRIGWRGDWFVNDVQLQAPVNVLQTYTPTPLPAELSGNLSLNISQLQINSYQCLSLEGQARWSQASITTPLGAVALDSPQFTLTCHNRSFVLNAEQSSAAIRSQTTLQLALSGRYQLQATLTAGNALPEALRSSLTLLGTSDAKGTFHIKQQGQLTNF